MFPFPLMEGVLRYLWWEAVHRQDAGPAPAELPGSGAQEHRQPDRGAAAPTRTAWSYPFETTICSLFRTFSRCHLLASGGREKLK